MQRLSGLASLTVSGVARARTFAVASAREKARTKGRTDRRTEAWTERILNGRGGRDTRDLTTQLGLRRPRATSHPPVLENIGGSPVTRKIILADHRQKVIDHIEGRTTENVQTCYRGDRKRDHARRRRDQE